MNPLLNHLQLYPFERLKQLLTTCVPNPQLSAISLGIGEPKHPTPAVVCQALVDAVNKHPSGLAYYPSTVGDLSLRQEISNWIARRYGAVVDATTQILPNNGSREALFAFGQAMVDPTGVVRGEKPIVVSSNPFYQIYEGACILGGAELYLVNQLEKESFQSNWRAVPADVWRRAQLVYVCSPNNPTGSTLGFDAWKSLFELSDQFGFVIAADECYSEIYSEDSPPVGALQVAMELGRTDYKNLLVFNSLSKRSNAPGMRSGFCAGNTELIKKFLLYRTYHGGAMSPVVQAASIAAWSDEEHVMANRKKYQEKFDCVLPILQSVLRVARPDAGFFLWAAVPGSDTDFSRVLYKKEHVTVLPGSYLAREQQGINPGFGWIRMALVTEVEECVEAANRIASMVKSMV